MNHISCAGEKGIAGTPSSGAASFSSGCADDADGVCCGIDSTSPGSLVVRLRCPFVDFDDVEAIEAMFVMLCVRLTKDRAVWSVGDSSLRY
jgi:hypothetical protein